MAKTYTYKDTNVKSSIFDYIQYKDVKVPNTKLLLVRGILSQYLSTEISDKKYVNAIDIYWNNPVVKPKNSGEISLGIFTTSDLLNYIKNSFSYNNVNVSGLIKKSDLDDYMNLSSLKTDIDYYILQINNILNKRFSYIDKNETNPGYNSIERGRMKKCLCKYADHNISNADDITFKFISFKDSGNQDSGNACLKLDWEIRIDNKASENNDSNDTYFSGTHDFSVNATLYLPENKDDKRYFSISVNDSNIFTIKPLSNKPLSNIPELSDKIITIKLKQHNDENSAQLENLEDVAELTYECTFLTNNANNDVDTRLVVNDIQYKGQSLYDEDPHEGVIHQFNNRIFDDINDKKAIKIDCGKTAYVDILYYYYFRWYDHISDYATESTSNGPWHGAYIFRDPINIEEKIYYNINEPDKYYTGSSPIDKYIIISNDIDNLKQLILNPPSDAHKIVIKNLNLLNDNGTELNPYIHFYERKDLGYDNVGSGSPTYIDENGNEKHIELNNLFEYSYKVLSYNANAGNLTSNICIGDFDLDLGDVFSNYSHWKVYRTPKYETKLLANKVAIHRDTYYDTSDSTITSYKSIPNGSLYYNSNLGSEYYYEQDQKPVCSSYFPYHWTNVGKYIYQNDLFDINFYVGPDELINYFTFISAKINYYNDAKYGTSDVNYKIYTHAPIITYRINEDGGRGQLYSFVYNGDPNDSNTQLIFVKSRNSKASDFFTDYTTEDNDNFTPEQDTNAKGSRILYMYDETKHEKIDHIEFNRDSVEITTNIYVYYNQRMKGYKIAGEDSTEKCWVDDNINWWKYTSITKTYDLTSNHGNIVDVKDLFGLSEYDEYNYIYRLFNKTTDVKQLFAGEDFTYGDPSNYLSWAHEIRYNDEEGRFMYSKYYDGKNSWLKQVGKVGENILVEDYLKNTYYNNPAMFIRLYRK